MSKVWVVLTETPYGGESRLRVYADNVAAQAYSHSVEDVDTVVVARECTTPTSTVHVVVSEKHYGGGCDMVRVFGAQSDACHYVDRVLAASQEVDVVVVERQVL